MAASESCPSAPTGLAGCWAQWTRFWFQPTAMFRLDALRVLIGATTLAFLLSFAGYQGEWFALDGYFDIRALTEAYKELPPESRWRQVPAWSPAYLVRTQTAVTVLYVLALLSSALFTAGVATRLTGVLTWLSVITFTSSPMFQGYDMDSLLVPFTLYLALGYGLRGLLTADPPAPVSQADHGAAGKWLALNPGWLEWPLAKQVDRRPSVAAAIALRLIQLHLCLYLLAAVGAKLRLPIWWSGLALWFPAHPVPLDMEATEAMFQRIRAYNPDQVFTILSVAVYAVLVWQLVAPFALWSRVWRGSMIAGAAVGWLGCVFLYGVPLYGPLVLAGTLAFCSTQEWALGLNWVRRWGQTSNPPSNAGEDDEDEEPATVRLSTKTAGKKVSN